MKFIQIIFLRLAMLNEEIRESADFAGGDDDTFNDVVQEFSQMVYTHPERLNKKSTMAPDNSTKNWKIDWNQLIAWIGYKLHE